MKSKRFPHYRPFAGGIHWSPVVSLQKVPVVRTIAGISLDMRPANGRRHYNVTTSLIGCAHTAELIPVNIVVWVILHMSLIIIQHCVQGLSDSVTSASAFIHLVDTTLTEDNFRL